MRKKPSRQPIAPVELIEEPKAAPVEVAPVVPLTDEGVPYEALSTTEIVNVSTDDYDARRRELRVKGRPFSHVGSRGSNWLYRHDS